MHTGLLFLRRYLQPIKALTGAVAIACVVTPLLAAEQNVANGSIAPRFSLTKEELQASRSEAREKSPLATHAYDRANALKYLAVLNGQFVSIESVALLLDDYEALKKKLADYDQFLDACILVRTKNLRKAYDVLCAAELQKQPSLRTAYYNFIDRVAYFSDVSKAKIIEASMKPLIADLAKSVDATTQKETELASSK